MTDLTELELCQRRVRNLEKRKNTWMQEAIRLGDLWDNAIVVPGHHHWEPAAERWRTLINHYMVCFGRSRYLLDPHRLLDLMVGIEWFESGGIATRICEVEWIGAPPPNYDPNDDSTKASGLFQMVPLWWPERSAAAGFPGRSIFDPEANIATACYMLWAGWPEEVPAPHFHHWSAAHVGRQGSYEKAKVIVDGQWTQVR